MVASSLGQDESYQAATCRAASVVVVSCNRRGTTTSWPCARASMTAARNWAGRR